MSRVPDLRPDELDDRQRGIHDQIAGTRGGAVRGPFALWLRLPELAERADALGGALRRGRLERRLFELMVLIVMRRWTAQYAWYAHARHAPEVGLDPAVVEAIRDRRVPRFARDDERLVYELVGELLDTHGWRDETYARAVDALGLETTIELVTSIGFYTTVAMMLRAFDAPVPGDAKPLT